MILDDTVALVTCCMCNERVPEDEAVEFDNNFYCNGDAEWGGVARCAWCGEGGDIMKMIIYDGDECHEECVREILEKEEPMTKEKPTKEEIKEQMDAFCSFYHECDEYDVAEGTEPCQRCPDPVFRAIRALISQPPVPKVVTREWVDKWVLQFKGIYVGEDDYWNKRKSLIQMLADLRIIVEEKP